MPGDLSLSCESFPHLLAASLPICADEAPDTCRQALQVVPTLQQAAVAHDAFLLRAAACAFAASDPGAALLQGALTGILDAVRAHTLRRMQVSWHSHIRAVHGAGPQRCSTDQLLTMMAVGRCRAAPGLQEELASLLVASSCILHSVGSIAFVPQIVLLTAQGVQAAAAEDAEIGRSFRRCRAYFCKVLRARSREVGLTLHAAPSSGCSGRMPVAGCLFVACDCAGSAQHMQVQELIA